MAYLHITIYINIFTFTVLSQQNYIESPQAYHASLTQPMKYANDIVYTTVRLKVWELFWRFFMSIVLSFPTDDSNYCSKVALYKFPHIASSA